MTHLIKEYRGEENMNVKELLKIYGEGDNSVTDRMWYEDAKRICLKLDSFNYNLDSRLCIEYVRGEIEKIVEKEKSKTS